MIFAAAFPAIVASVALGVDLSNTLTTKTEMQDANDAAVLFAARVFKETRKQPTLAKVQVFLDANSNLKVKAKKLAFNPDRTEFTLDSSADVKTLLMGYFGQKYQNYVVISKANLGFSETLEFVLALDTTGSMAADGKMAGLKDAANDFIDSMFDAKDRGADIKGGIVPFAQYVNVGASRRGQSWLNIPKDVDTRVTTKACRKEAPVTGKTNCRTEFTPGRTINHPARGESCQTNDGTKVCSPGSPAWSENIPAGKNETCDNIYGAEETICENVTTGDFSTWQGYVGSRAYPLNVQDVNYRIKVPGLLNVSGSVELQTLTDERNKLKNKIAELSPDGETYLPDGVIWGTRVLSKLAPFTEGAISGKGGRQLRKTLVLMTDGMNTISPNGEFHTNTDSALADKYTIEACNEAKAQKIELFTISFGSAVPNSANILLEKCASKPENFFNAKSSADLKAAFQKIAGDMLNIRLSQ